MGRARFFLARAFVPLLIAFPPIAHAQTTASVQAVERIHALPGYIMAVATLDREHDRFVDEIVALTEIPAPPFAEKVRAAAFADMLKASGLAGVETDDEGNVMALRRGSGRRGGKIVVISAHLDTVFPEGTDVTVRREGTKLMAPGIGDDSRGLAAMLAYARALDAAGIETRHDILFLGTVGEEGKGDLRGVRHFFTGGKYKGRVRAFFSLDGLNPARIVNGGIGSKRYRATFKGPGGHSYSAFGIVNPMAAMSRSIVDLYAVQPPARPRTTYSASVTGGGTSVNSIPNEVFAEFDMRSESPEALAALEKRFLGILASAVAAENAARITREGAVTVEPEVIGDRPAGQTARSSDLVALTAAAVAAAGYSPVFAASSTDSNLPMSLGVPAVTIGSGGSGGRSHALDEYIDVEKGESVKGLAVGLTALIAVAGVR